MNQVDGRRRGRAARIFGRLALLIAVAGVAGAAGWWAARATLLSAPAIDDQSVETVSVTVVDGSVGRSLAVGITVRQPLVTVATNTLVGMVTQVSAGGTVDTGDTVFQVAGIPVRVVAGTVPFWRDLAQGVRGADVAQLSAALARLGYLDAEPDDDFGSLTRQAVEAWQRDLGLAVTGTVAYGEVLAVPSLPAVVRLGEDLRVGVPVVGGEPGLLMARGVAEFTAVLGADQAQTITAEVPLTVTFEDLVWPAQVVSSTVDDNGFVVYALAGPDGGLVCGNDCARLPPDERLSLRGQAQVVPEVSGPTVPVAAVHTDDTGATYLVRPDGTRVDVTVRGSGQGVAVVDGVAVGEAVVVYDAVGG
jgi:hypothetical protein